MKTLVNGLHERHSNHIIACFGRARLVTRPDGRAELRGGTESQRTDAKEWISLFMHEAVLSRTAEPVIFPFPPPRGN